MQAVVLRVAPSEIGRVPETLESDQIIIDWANAKGLLDKRLDWTAFRELVRETDDFEFYRMRLSAVLKVGLLLIPTKADQ